MEWKELCSLIFFFMSTAKKEKNKKQQTYLKSFAQTHAVSQYAATTWFGLQLLYAFHCCVPHELYTFKLDVKRIYS